MKKNLTKEKLLEMYESLFKIRRFEEVIVDLYPEQKMRTPVHLCIGQEASAVGVCLNLCKDDYLFSHHRSHGHCIAKGMPLKKIMAELYGKKTGSSSGKGGSMHLVDLAHGILGTSSIVAGALPLATGTALASAIKGDGKVSVVFFGDGAIANGAFHESLNFASLKKLPVVFVCENNFFATYSPLAQRMPSDSIYKKAKAYDLPGFRVDGNDCCQVYEVARQAIQRARLGLGPSLIECRTFRWKEHVGIEDNISLGFRGSRLLDSWKKRCPIKRMRELLISDYALPVRKLQDIDNEIIQEINQAIKFAQLSPIPKKGDLLKDVY